MHLSIPFPLLPVKSNYRKKSLFWISILCSIAFILSSSSLSLSSAPSPPFLVLGRGSDGAGFGAAACMDGESTSSVLSLQAQHHPSLSIELYTGGLMDAMRGKYKMLHFIKSRLCIHCERTLKTKDPCKGAVDAV